MVVYVPVLLYRVVRLLWFGSGGISTWVLVRRAISVAAQDQRRACRISRLSGGLRKLNTSILQYVISQIHNSQASVGPAGIAVCCADIDNPCCGDIYRVYSIWYIIILFFNITLIYLPESEGQQRPLNCEFES